MHQKWPKNTPKWSKSVQNAPKYTQKWRKAQNGGGSPRHKHINRHMCMQCIYVLYVYRVYMGKYTTGRYKMPFLPLQPPKQLNIPLVECIYVYSPQRKVNRYRRAVGFLFSVEIYELWVGGSEYEKNPMKKQTLRNLLGGNGKNSVKIPFHRNTITGF